MSFKPSGHSARLVSAFTLVAAVTLTTAPAQQPESRKNFFGRTTVAEPERSDAGNFHGTWWYYSRDFKAAFWIENEDGGTRLKFRLLNTNTRESFATDWSGQAEYAHRGRVGRFSMSVDEADENTISGSWDWELIGPDFERVESTGFELYRSGDGRRLVLKFQDLKRSYGGEEPATYDLKRQYWTFHKGSRRMARWEELPF